MAKKRHDKQFWEMSTSELAEATAEFDDEMVMDRGTELSPEMSRSLALTGFVHQRHKPPMPLERARELIVACAPLRSNANLSHIVRVAGCCGVQKVICCGHAKIIDKIARDGAEALAIEVHRTLPPVLKELKHDGYRLVGLEQTTGSENLHEFRFDRRTALVIGNERLGLTDDLLALVDQVVEIPIFGLPYSYNVATATAMALYEFCRQYPRG